MQRSSQKAPWIILGCAAIGAITLSLFSVSPTPAQFGGPQPTQIGAAGPITLVPTNTPFGSSGQPAGQPTATPRPTQGGAVNPPAAIPTLPNISGSGFPDLSALNSALQTAMPSGFLTQLPSQMMTSLPAQMMATQSSIQTPAATSGTPGPSTPGTPGSTQTVLGTVLPTSGTAVATASTTASVLPTLGTALPTSPTPTPVPQPAAALPAQPVVAVDSPEQGAGVTMGRPVLIGGWAVDPRGVGTGITEVDVFMGGGPGTGTYVGSAMYGLPREDVAAYFGKPEWMASGFNMEWTPRGVPSGQQTLTIVARTAAGDSTTTEVQVTIRGGGEG